MTEPATIFTPPKNPPVNSSPAGQPVLARSHEPSTPAQQRWAADRAAVAKGDPWQGDPSRTVLARQLDGSIVERPRTDGGANGVSGNQPAPAIEDGKLRIGEMLLDEKDIRAIMTESAVREARKATLPASPAEYALDLPDDFQMPQGFEFRWAVDDPVQGPLINMAREFAHANGIDQAAFSKMMSLYVASRVHEDQNFARAKAAEVAKLGATGPARVDAAMQFLRGTVGDDLAKALSVNLFTAKQIQAVEALMHRFTNQGGGSWSGAHRELSQPQRLSDEAYSKLTYSEKKEYAAMASARDQGRRR